MERQRRAFRAISHLLAADRHVYVDAHRDKDRERERLGRPVLISRASRQIHWRRTPSGMCQFWEKDIHNTLAGASDNGVKGAAFDASQMHLGIGIPHSHEHVAGGRHIRIRCPWRGLHSVDSV